MRQSHRVCGLLELYRNHSIRPSHRRLALLDFAVPSPRHRRIPFQSRELDSVRTRVRSNLRSAKQTTVLVFRPLNFDTGSADYSADYNPDLTKNAFHSPVARRSRFVYIHFDQNHFSRKHLHSSASSGLYLVPIIAGALLVYTFAFGPSPDIRAAEGYYRESDTTEIEMTTEALPGRPGNLTPEEEEKLRKFWEMFLQLCGVFDEDVADGTAPAPGKVEAPSAEKSKRKRLYLFKKKKDKSRENKGTDKDVAELAARQHDPEDKWGESKAYHETLAKHTPEEIRATIWSMVKHDNPDALLLRFLRARKWDLQRALVMMVSTIDWRASDMRVDSDVMINGEEHALLNEKSSDAAAKRQGADFLAQMRLGKSYCYGTDKAGRPICFCRARLHKAGEQSEESLERYTVYLIETTRFLISPPVDTGCVVFDLTGFSIANMDYTPVKFMIRCFEANYPESLGVVLVHKAPWVFQGIWRIIRGWLDPVVASKVHFTNNLDDLEHFIAKEKIPDDMEGSSGWTYEYIEPVRGENHKMKDTKTRDVLLKERDTLYEDFENKTIEWLHEDDRTKRSAIKLERNTIAQKLRDQYWRLDPYIRSRSLYDRVGVIKSDGSLNYYPPWRAVTATNGAVATAVETSADDVD